MEKLKVLKLHPDARIPTRANKTDVGYDLYSLEDVFIPFNETKIVKTGITFEIPVGYVGKIEDRSSMAAKGLKTGGGIIDPAYRNDVGVILNNLTYDEPIEVGGGRPGFIYPREYGYKIKAGDRIAQILFIKVELPDIEEATELSKDDRGGGLGSTGV